MRKIRIGMDVIITFAVMRISGPEDLTTANGITVKLIHTQSTQWHLSNSFEVINDNTLKIRVKGSDQIRAGQYRIIVAYTKYNAEREPHNEPFIIDSLAFELVPYSSMVEDSYSGANLNVEQISLSGSIDKCKDGIDGATPEIGDNNNWWIRGIDTEISARGIKGDRGAQGIQGAKGGVGAQGIQGVKGDKGDVGARGTQGAKGDVGAQGVKGDVGETGGQSVTVNSIAERDALQVPEVLHKQSKIDKGEVFGQEIRQDVVVKEVLTSRGTLLQNGTGFIQIQN